MSTVETTDDAEPVYFWGGYVINEYGYTRWKYSIGTLYQVVFDMETNTTFPGGKSPEIQCITGCRPLNEGETEKLQEIKEMVNDI